MASEIVPFTPYTPNWALITKVLGTKQAEYDRGFSMVKSVYDSVLNSPLTNQENEQFRSEAFKKLQNSLKSVSMVDLSNPTNVMRATNLMNPITEDQDYVYDIAWTRAQNKQKQLLESTRNSSDPKISAQYNEDSLLDLQLAELRMKEAKRGDGSIQKVQPGEFVPYQDYMADLDKIANDNKLKIVKSTLNPEGYVVTDTNGKQAEPSFIRWAMSHLDNKYDRQFTQMGRVKSELQVRNLMDNTKVSREDAINQISSGLLKNAVDKYTQNISTYQNGLNELDEQIETFQKLYPNNKVPKTNQNVQQEYNNLVQLRDLYKQEIESAKGEVGKLQKDGPSYFAKNLASYYTSDLKQTAAREWGVNRANTSEVEHKIEPDQIWITNRNNATSIALKNAELNMRAAEMRWDMKQFEMEFPLKERAQALDELEFQMTGSSSGRRRGTGAGTTGTGGTGKKTENPFDEFISYYSPSGSSSTPAADMLTKSMTRFRTKAFDLSFGASNGLINLVVKPQEFNTVNTVLNKVKQIGEGSNQKLTVPELTTLKNYGAKIGMSYIKNPSTSAEANMLVDMMAHNTYKKASEVIKTYVKFDKSGNISNIVANFKPALDAFKSLADQSGELALANYNLAQYIEESPGVPKAQFKNAKLVEIHPMGYGVYNTDALSPEQKKELENVMDRELLSRMNATGTSWALKAVTPSEVQFLLNSKAKLAFSENSEKLKTLLQIDPDTKRPIMSPDQLQELFNGKAQLDIDPQSETVTMTYNVDYAGELAKSKAINITTPQSVSVTLGYDEINASPNLSRLQDYIKTYQIDTQLSSFASKFANYAFTEVKSDSYLNNYGFEYSVTGTNNHGSQYGVNLYISMLHPKTKMKMEHSDFIPISNPNNPANFREIQERIDKAYNSYVLLKSAYENSFKTDETVDLK